MSSSAPELFPAAPGVALRLLQPEGARPLSPDALPSIDVSALSGAQVTLREGAEADGLVLRALCVVAPSGRWAPGVESLVLDRAAWLARAAVGGAVDRWDAAPILATDGRFEQRFEGAGSRAGGEAVAIRGRHTLAFAGEDHDAVLCSVACVEPAAAPARCAQLVDAAQVEGALVGPPPPSLLVRGIVLAAERPTEVSAASALLATVCIAMLLAKRPRPRPWR